MLTRGVLFGFAIALPPLALSPGVSFTLVTAKGVQADHGGVAGTILGTAAGILTHATAAGLGLALVVMQSAAAYSAIRLVGAAYLVGLGLRMLWRSWRSDALAAVLPPPGSPPPAPTNWARSLFTAYLANVLNVKAAAVYLTLAPQFLSPEQMSVSALLCLGLVHVAIMATWLSAWAGGLHLARRRFDPARWSRHLNAAGAGVLIGLGVRTAVSR